MTPRAKCDPRDGITNQIARSLTPISPQMAAEVLAELLAAIEIEHHVGAEGLLREYLILVNEVRQHMNRLDS